VKTAMQQALLANAVYGTRAEDLQVEVHLTGVAFADGGPRLSYAAEWGGGPAIALDWHLWPFRTITDDLRYP